jgi:alkyl hydroperoxide reductase subunit AhpC
MATVGKRIPDFDLPCTMGSPATRRQVTPKDYSDRWLLLVFYPRDFSLVCPTELLGLSARMPEFRRRGCELLGISTDSIELHERWLTTPRAQGGLAGLQFPLASDLEGSVSRDFGVYLEQQRVALRGVFIIDPNGVLQYQAVHNLSVGRRSEDIVRVLAALETGGMCPEDWCVDGATLDPTQALVPGSQIAHYRIEEEVGRGAFAVVYRARDLTLQRVVALKVFKPGGPATPGAILAEARAAAALAHPNACTVFAVDDSEGVPVIAMEYVDGRPLSAVLEDGRLPLEGVSRIGCQIALGMAAAHRLGVIHGDLKPANILLTREDTVKITDFGLARRLSPTADSEKTQPWGPDSARKIAGTPCYMSPEQSLGEPPTPASDVFSFGLVLYELWTGRKAFVGENVLQVLHQIRNVDPDRLAAEVPGRFTELLRRLLAREPRNRLLTMEEAARILE